MASQTVQVAAGSGTAAVNARLSGVLSGSGGLTMIGYGTLELTASNTYTGPTTVSGIILRLSNSGALPGGSNLTLDGGVIELAAGDFTCNLGTGPGQVQFTSNGGGFSAVGANRIVNLGNSAQLTWGSGSFLPNGAPLMLGTPSDDSTVDFQNPINLGSGPQTVLVASGLAAVDAELSGILSGSGGLTMAGNGTLVLSGTDNTYTGGTVVEGGILVLESNGALADGSSLTIGAARRRSSPRRPQRRRLRLRPRRCRNLARWRCCLRPWPHFRGGWRGNGRRGRVLSADGLRSRPRLSLRSPGPAAGFLDACRRP